MKKIVLLMVAVSLVFACGRASAISEKQENAISDHCGAIVEDLKTVQRNDARLRINLGRYYETIAAKFVTPLNVRLVENNMSSASLVDNQNNFTRTRTSFSVDYIEYQRALEELIAIDCKTRPVEFYDELEVVRQRRAVVAEDTEKLRELAAEHGDLVTELEQKL